MSSRDSIDERHADLVRELRGASVAAPERLHVRVREIAAGRSAPAPARQTPRPRRLGFGARRAALVFAPAAIAVALGAAVGAGIFGSGRETAVTAEPPVTALDAQRQGAGAVGGATALEKGAASLPSTRGRAQDYQAELGLRVRDLSEATQRALRLTRSYGGFVRSVDYGSGEEAGRADAVLRIPIGSVQEAIVRLSGLGEIVSQHVSIRDLQPALDRRFRRMQALRLEIARLQRAIDAAAADDPERTQLVAKLTRARAELVSLQRVQSRARRTADFATVSLALRSEQEGAVPAAPGRVERAFDRAIEVLATEAIVLLYAVLLGGPVVLLASLGLVGLRGARRRAGERLLAG